MSGGHDIPVRVAVVAEFYPSERDPVLGVWAHRQALAARDAGAEVRVIVLHRLVPPRATLADGPAAAVRAMRARAAEPRRQVHDGLTVEYVPYVSPPASAPTRAGARGRRPRSALALRRLRSGFRYELIHAHNAVPAADAVRRTRTRGCRSSSPSTAATSSTPPRAVARAPPPSPAASEPGGSCSPTARASPSSASATEHARRAWCTSARTCPGQMSGLPPGGEASLVTVAHLIARKRHGDVLRAIAVLGRRYPRLRYRVIGDGPERTALEGLAARLEISDRVDFLGQLPPQQAIDLARRSTLFVMPSTEEAFGVAYVEAMAGGVPAIGCRGEPGPEEIAAAGDGMVLVPPGDIERLTQRIEELLSDGHRLREAGSARGRRSPAASPGSTAGSRRSPPTGRPWLEAAAVRHRERAGVPGRRPARAARARADRAGAVRRCDPCTPGPGLTDNPAHPLKEDNPARAVRARRRRALPRRRPLHRRARLAARRLGRGARRARLPLILWASLWSHPR